MIRRVYLMRKKNMGDIRFSAKKLQERLTPTPSSSDWAGRSDPLKGPTTWWISCPKAQKEHGFIEASSRWFPSCSFLEDTAAVIAQAALTYPPGTYLVNSNRKYSFFEIAEFLKTKHHAHWNIRETVSFKRDDRMADPRVEMPELF